MQSLLNERDGTNLLNFSDCKHHLKSEPIPTLIDGMRLARTFQSNSAFELYGHFQQRFLHEIASQSGATKLFQEEDDPKLLTEAQTSTLVETLNSACRTLPTKTLVVLTVLRAVEKGGGQFPCLQDFGSGYLGKYSLKYDYNHCEHCFHLGSHRSVAVMSDTKCIGSFCIDCYLPSNRVEYYGPS